MKIVTVIGTRPEIIKLSRVIPRLNDCCRHVLVHTGQNFDHELNGIFFHDLRLRRPDYFLKAAGASLAETIGNIIAKSDKVFERERPDALLVLGDTNSALCALAAKRRKIPIFHMEAGNRCFDQRVPEEINRKLVDHLSDINLTYTEHARRYLLAEGLPADRVLKTGSPMKEVLDFHRQDIDAFSILERLKLRPKRFFTVSIHREENVDDPAHLKLLVQSLNRVAREFDWPLIFSAHPRTRKRLAASGFKLDARVRSMPPLGFFDYVALQMNSYCTLSDSGTISEESSILGFAAVTVREAHERPEAMDEGAVIMTGLKPGHLLNSIRLAVRQLEEFGPSRTADDYAVSQVSWKVAKIIFSYTDYVNRRVWFKA